MADQSWAVLATPALIVIGVLAWRVREARGRRRSEAMESFLRTEKAGGEGRGQRSAKLIMEKLGMTASQVRDACRRSPAIKQLATTANFSGAIFADSPIYEYAPLGSQGRDAI
jgi:hypothetical protein